MSRKLVAGNWKMNGGTAANAALVKALLADIGEPRCDVVVCPPAVYLGQVRDLCGGNAAVQLGAQDVAAAEGGAHTGDIAASMLADFGVRFCIVGHSERRRYQHESDLTVGYKAAQALAAGITPIVCVGETLEQRRHGLTEFTVLRQLDAVIQINRERLVDIVLAYEPIWAIGTGESASPEQAQQVHAALRARLRAVDAAVAGVRILYGGSMNADNAAALLAQADIDGGLIGGAALKAAEFLKIVATAGQDGRRV